MEYRKESCDILILGGGVGGLCCAVATKELNPEADILIVEKNFSGYSGKANRGGGVLQYFDPNKIDPWEFVKFHAEKIGAYLGDQELMAKYVEMNPYMLEKLASWGASLPRRDDGTFNVFPTGPMTAMIATDLDITLKIRRTAEKYGVRFIDKTALIDLLTDENGITGAVVFSILDGTPTVIEAKKVVLATGSQNYRIGSMWSSGRGDGIAAAYRAGARLRNTEFGNFAQLARVRSHNEVVFGENLMYNAKDEHITKNFLKERETDITSTAIREWFTQIRDGNGPVRVQFPAPPPPPPKKEGEDAPPPAPRPKRYGDTFRNLNHAAAAKVDRDMEVAPLFIGEQSPIAVNHNMKTSIDGLYAIGDCSYCGSGVAGAVPAPPGRNRGSGILNAVFAAIQCAEEIGRADLSVPLRAIDESQVLNAFARAEAPLNTEPGVCAKDVIALIQKAMAPVEQSVWMRKDRMEKAMRYVEQAEEIVPRMHAADTHGVLECLEAEAMVLSAKMHYKASEMRKESRGWFLREDYPETDNEHWHKWIVVQQVDGRMTLSTEDIPPERFPAPGKS